VVWKVVTLQNPYMDPKIVSPAVQEVSTAQELLKFRILTLRFDLFDLEDDLRCC